VSSKDSASSRRLIVLVHLKLNFDVGKLAVVGHS